MLFSPVFAANHLRPVSTKTAGCVANNSHSGTHLTVAALFTTLKFFLFTLLHTLLHAQKLIRFPFMYLRTLCTKHPGVGGVPLSPKSRQKPRLGYTLLSGGSLGSRQKYSAHPHRPVSHRQSSGRQPRVSRLDARLSSSFAPHPGAPGRSEQFYPVDCLVPHRHPHFAFLWNLYSRSAGRRRSQRYFQRLGHVEEQKGDGPRPGCSEESELEGHLSQRVLSADAAAHCRPRI